MNIKNAKYAGIIFCLEDLQIIIVAGNVVRMTLKQYNIKKKLKTLLKGDSRASAIFQMNYYDVLIMLEIFQKMDDEKILDLVEGFHDFQVVSRGLYEGVIRALDVYTVEEILNIFSLIHEYHEKPNYEKKEKIIQ